MSTLNELLARAQEVRDEQEVGGNTALRVGQLLADIIQWCADTDADFVESVEHYVAQLNERDGIINWWQSRILILKTMGSDFDDVDVSSLSNGDLYYDSVGKWLFERENGGSVNGHHPSGGVLYVNIGNGMSYRWDGSAMRAIRPDDVWDAIQNLRDNVDMILAALGNYAFPGGKPATDWSGGVVEFSVTYPSDSKVTHTGAGDTVELGSSLEVTLGIASGNDLYAIKDSSVKVYMGGVEQSGAYNSSTQKVTLSAVTGNVVIVAEAWTYVSRGLVMHLDGRNRGGTAGKWKSLVDYNSNPLYFKLENCDEQSDYVAGNGTSSKGTAFSNSALTTAVTLLDVGASEGTIEAAYSHAEIASNGNMPIMHNGLGSGNRICLTSWHSSSAGDSENTIVMSTAQGSAEVLSGISYNYPKTSINTGGYISLKQGSFMLNGTTVAAAGDTNQSTTGESKLSIFYRRTSNDQFAKYRLYALRVYSVQLTDAERAQNLAIDQKRFNLS